MTRLLNQSPQGKHGKHEYSLEEFGLTAAGVREHFHDYWPIRADQMTQHIPKWEYAWATRLFDSYCIKGEEQNGS